jgi:hypothetical protein
VAHVVCVGGNGNLYSVLVGKSEGERTLGTTRHILHNDVKMGLQVL